MTNYKNYFSITVIFFIHFSLFSQNILDYDHSIKYANKLYGLNEFSDAYIELIEIKENFHSSDENDEILLLKTCMALNKTEELFYRFKTDLASKNISDNLLKFIVTQYLVYDSLALAYNVLTNFNFKFKNELLLNYAFLNHNYEMGYKIMEANKNDLSDSLFYNDLSNKILTSTYKNKEIALAFSILIPASGKYYLKQNTDATLGLLLTSLYGGLAYSAFYKSGVSSVFAWINCAAFGALYVGNILGTASAVNRFNNKINIELKNAIKDKLQSILAM